MYPYIQLTGLVPALILSPRSNLILSEVGPASINIMYLGKFISTSLAHWSVGDEDDVNLNVAITI